MIFSPVLCRSSDPMVKFLNALLFVQAGTTTEIMCRRAKQSLRL